MFRVVVERLRERVRPPIFRSVAYSILTLTVRNSYTVTSRYSYRREMNRASIRDLTLDAAVGSAYTYSFLCSAPNVMLRSFKIPNMNEFTNYGQFILRSSTSSELTTASPSTIWSENPRASSRYPEADPPSRRNQSVASSTSTSSASPSFKSSK